MSTRTMVFLLTIIVVGGAALIATAKPIDTFSIMLIVLLIILAAISFYDWRKNRR